LTLEMRVLWSVVIYIGKVTGANPPRNGDE
jgi:hypothetical protein